MTDPESKIQTLLAGNKEISKDYHMPLKMEQMRPMSFSTGGALIILTCLDPRCVPERFFGPEIGIPVFRNAGGRATPDAIRSIMILRSLIGASGVLVIHHTDCGKTHITDEEVREEGKKRTPGAKEEIEEMEFRCGPAGRFEEMVREDVGILRGTGGLEGVLVRGMKLDTVTGVVTELEG